MTWAQDTSGCKVQGGVHRASHMNTPKEIDIVGLPTSENIVRPRLVYRCVQQTGTNTQICKYTCQHGSANVCVLLQRCAGPDRSVISIRFVQVFAFKYARAHTHTHTQDMHLHNACEHHNVYRHSVCACINTKVCTCIPRACLCVYLHLAMCIVYTHGCMWHEDIRAHVPTCLQFSTVAYTSRCLERGGPKYYISHTIGGYKSTSKLL